MTNITTTKSESKALGLEFTEPRKKKLIELVSAHGNKTRACAEIGISTTTLARHMERDPYYREMVEAAHMQFLGRLEDAAFERAVTGTKKDIYFQGQVVGEETVYSDKLLETLLKANSSKYQTKANNNNTLIVADSGGVVDALGKFLGVDLSKPDSDSQDKPGGDIVEGEYVDVGTEESGS